jgi:Cu+-exporting ATPase
MASVAEVDGRSVLLGNLRLMEREGVHLNGLVAKAQALQDDAKTAMWLAVDGQASAVIGVADTIKDGSKEAVAGDARFGPDGGDDDRRQPGHGPGHRRRSGH